MDPMPDDTAADLRRRTTLLLTLCALFIGFFVAANLIGVKLFSFTVFGIGPKDLGLGNDVAFTATAGILAFPLTFILTDLINEYFGWRTVRTFTILAVAVSLLLQVVVQAAAQAPTVQFDAMPAPLAGAAASLAASATPAMSPAAATQAIAHAGYQLAFAGSIAVVIGSLTAFLVGQVLDIAVFSWLRRATAGKALWLRAQGSTVVSQLVDTFVVIYVAFVIIPWAMGIDGMSGSDAFSVSSTNYVYKFAIAVALTPLLYLTHALMDRWLGHAHAARMIAQAHAGRG